MPDPISTSFPQNIVSESRKRRILIVEDEFVNREILKSIIGICRKLGIHTLAEGVETEEQREFLIEIGCELAHGYLYHRPDALDSILYKRQNGRRNHQVVTRKRLKELI